MPPPAPAVIPDWLVARSTVVALAVVGAVVSVAASMLHRQGRVSPERAKLINRIGYGFMWVSVTLFIIAGFRGGA